MFRMWGKVWKENHMIKDIVIKNKEDLSRTKKVFKSIETMAHELDLGQPIWLDKNIKEFQKFSKTRFYQDNFIEEIEFDYLEILIIEED